MIGWRVLSVGVLALVSVSCVTTLYQGQRDLLGTDAPVLESVDTIVDEIDGVDLRELRLDRSRYVLPPGPHVIGFSLLKLPMVLPGGHVSSFESKQVRVCLVAERGHRYQTAAAPERTSSSWTLFVLDTNGSVPSVGPARRRAPLGCARDRLFPGASKEAPPPAVAAVAAVAALPAPTDGGQAAETPTSPPPPAPAPSGVNEVLRLRSHERIDRYDPYPHLDLTLSFSYASGGDQVARINAGDGLSLNVGALLTPLWASSWVGVGAGIELGFKRGYTVGRTTTEVTLNRYPVDATFHAAIRLAARWFVMLAGGVTKDFAMSHSGYGGPLSSELGILGRLTLYYRVADSSAVLLGVQQIDQRYSAGTDGTFDAGSRSIIGAVSFAL